MNLNEDIYKYGLVKYVLENGGDIAPLEIDTMNLNDIALSSMNPSIYLINDNEAYLNIRCVDYVLFNSLNIRFLNTSMSYVNGILTYLSTVNYFGTINLNTLEINNISKVNTSLFDQKPLWDFIGLEDARVVVWDNKIYLCGVRRDTTTNGEGRMELSEIVYKDDEWVEVNRERIPANENNDSYCEKNWMPILNHPYTWVKKINSDDTEIAKYDPITNNTNVIKTNNINHINKDLRGDSQVIYYNGYYYSICHTAHLSTYDSTRKRYCYYKHYFIKYDSLFNVIDISEPWSYINNINVEFGCGMCLDSNNNVYITYSENDSAAYILKFNINLLFN